jgi:hypothetical protein
MTNASLSPGLSLPVDTWTSWKALLEMRGPIRVCPRQVQLLAGFT